MLQSCHDLQPYIQRLLPLIILLRDLSLCNFVRSIRYFTPEKWDRLSQIDLILLQSELVSNKFRYVCQYSGLRNVLLWYKHLPPNQHKQHERVPHLCSVFWS